MSSGYAMSTGISGASVHTSVSLIKKRKSKMKLNWFRRKFAQWSRRAWEDAKQLEYENHDNMIKQADPSSNGLSYGNTNIRFTIYSASGGHVIEYHKQDRFKDNDRPSLTIVPHGEELGKAIEYIIAVEALKS